MHRLIWPLLGVALSALLWHPHFGARLGLIDDHEIYWFLGEKRTLAAADIPSRLMSTELGAPGVAIRYRPAYHLVRVTETWLWGDRALPRYLLRLLCFAALASVTFSLCVAHFGPGLGVAGALFLLSPAYLDDIFARLGPGEGLAALGLALWLPAFFALWRDDRARLPDVLALVTGTLLAAGSKENFCALVVPLWALAWRRHRRGALGGGLAAALVVCFTYIHWIGAALATAYFHKGPYLQRKAVTAEVLGNVALSVLGDWRFWLALGAVLWLARRRRPLAVALGVCGLVVLSQVFFYRGWPPANRYAFPCFAALQIAVLFLLRELPRPALRALASVVLIAAAVPGLGGHVAAASRNRDRTVRFTEAFDALRRKASARPDLPVVVVTRHLWDYEPALVLRRYVRHGGLRNPFFLDVRFRSRKGMLAKALRRTSREGLMGYRPAGERPSGACLSVGIRGPGEPSCRDLGRLW